MVYRGMIITTIVIAVIWALILIAVIIGMASTGSGGSFIVEIIPRVWFIYCAKAWYMNKEKKQLNRLQIVPMQNMGQS